MAEGTTGAGPRGGPGVSSSAAGDSFLDEQAEASALAARLSGRWVLVRRRFTTSETTPWWGRYLLVPLVRVVSYFQSAGDFMITEVSPNLHAFHSVQSHGSRPNVKDVEVVATKAQRSQDESEEDEGDVFTPDTFALRYARGKEFLLDLSAQQSGEGRTLGSVGGDVFEKFLPTGRLHAPIRAALPKTTPNSDSMCTVVVVREAVGVQLLKPITMPRGPLPDLEPTPTPVASGPAGGAGSGTPLREDEGVAITAMCFLKGRGMLFMDELEYRRAPFDVPIRP